MGTELADRLPRLRAAASGYPEARLVAIFGSVARGRPLPWSDVDVGILGCPFWRGVALGRQIGDILEREPHVVELDTAPDALRYRISADGVLLHEAEPGLWASWRANAWTR